MPVANVVKIGMIDTVNGNKRTIFLIVKTLCYDVLLNKSKKSNTIFVRDSYKFQTTVFVPSADCSCLTHFHCTFYSNLYVKLYKLFEHRSSMSVSHSIGEFSTGGMGFMDSLGDSQNARDFVSDEAVQGEVQTREPPVPNVVVRVLTNSSTDSTSPASHHTQYVYYQLLFVNIASYSHVYLGC